MDQILTLSSVLLWLVVLFNLLLTYGLIRRQNNSEGMHRLQMSTLKVGQPAPNFTAETLQGETIKLATYHRRAVVFIFVSPHCGPCHDLMPKLEALQPKAKQAGVELVIVSQANGIETQTFVTEHNISLPTLVAPPESNSFGNDYKVGGTPFYCFVDSDRKIQATGFLDSGWDEELTKRWTAKAVGLSQAPIPSLTVGERG